MPGMMDTVLNLGLNDKSVKGLAKSTSDERFAYDSYRRFIAMYGRIVLGVEGEQFDHPLEAAREKAGAKTDADDPGDELKELCEHFKAVVKKADRQAVPAEPDRAAARRGRGGVPVVERRRGRSPTACASASSTRLGTAVNVQAMVFGNRDDNSGTGVGFTRNAATGENKPYGDFLVNAQGEDVVAGIRNTEDLDHMKQHFPVIHDELLAIFARLEAHYRDMCDTEFTIDQGKLWMLQTRVGKRTGAAALRMAVDMTKGTGKGAAKWKISREEALTRVTDEHLDAVLHPQFAEKSARCSPPASPRRPAPPSARCTSPPTRPPPPPSAARRSILVRNETSPEDVHGMMVAEGHPHRPRRPRVSHAAVVARGWGTPAIVGAESVKIIGDQFSVGDVVVNKGDVISLDGTTGEVVLGRASSRTPSRRPSSTMILKWADQVRKGKLAVRANADTGEDAANARELGAEGIGLCRTEHMFLAPDRLPVVRKMILADTPKEEAARSTSCAWCSRSTSRRSSRRWTGCPSRSACSTRRCTSSCRRSRSCASRRPRRACPPKEQASWRPPRAGPSTTR